MNSLSNNPDPIQPETNTPETNTPGISHPEAVHTAPNKSIASFSPVHKKMTTGVKLALLGVQCLVLMIGVLIVRGITDDREGYSEQVLEEIDRQWGAPLDIGAPMLLTDRQNMDMQYGGTSCVNKATVDVETLHRNSYEAEIYTANVSMSAKFDPSDFESVGDEWFFHLNFDTSKLEGTPIVKINGTPQIVKVTHNAIECEIPVADRSGELTVQTDFKIHGSRSLYFKTPYSGDIVEISGHAKNPSFQGEFLPDKREVSEHQFSAVWHGKDVREGASYDYVGAKFNVGVDRYQKVLRSLKYSFLIILLTYVSVFLVEIMMKRNIPLFNYFLIGFALIIFYTLLLSFAELMPFGIAYLIASAMTVLMISVYLWKMLASGKIGITLGAVLSGLYVCCYILLSLSTYSLLLGSVILFLAVAAMMYGSLRLKR